jgi:integrase
MSVYRADDRECYRYDFWLNKRRYLGSTGQTRKDDAVAWEAKYKLRLRQHTGGIAALDITETPTFQEWAEVYYTDARTRMRHPERVDHLLRVILRFWGRKPDGSGKTKPVQGEPYHDLHLADPVIDPYWVIRFEEWMAARALSGQTRNQYRSTLSQLFELAMQPAYRTRTGIMMNPFRGIRRDRPRKRVAIVSVDELRAWIAHASYHVRLAMAIAALAPTLRVGNILALQWRQHVDKGVTRIVVGDHKTADDTGEPLVVSVSGQLRAILEDARRRAPISTHVVSYRGVPVKTITSGVHNAANRAGLHYGRTDGITFHTLRHAMATLFAQMSDVDGGPALSESQRMRLMGHTRLETTQIYTHIAASDQRPHIERLATVVPLLDLVTHRRNRATREPIPSASAGGINGGTPIGGGRKSLGK